MPAPSPELLAHRQDVLAHVRRILVEKLHVQRAPEEIDPDTPLFGTGIGLDSIDAVDLAVCLDADFGLHLSNEVGGRAALRTVNGIVDLVLAHERRARHA